MSLSRPSTPVKSPILTDLASRSDSIGDTHGQFYDFLNLLSLTGKPSPTHALLFNGDFVDRGSWSTEILLVLFAYKWLYPNKVFLNRGNHETCECCVSNVAASMPLS